MKTTREKVRRVWTLNPRTRVIPNKRLMPPRKAKHRKPEYGE